MIFHTIQPVCGLMQTGYGNITEYSITGVSDIRYERDTEFPGLLTTIQKEIMERLRCNNSQGAFQTSAYTPGGTILYVTVEYHTMPDYNIFQRIYRWWYNFNSQEMLSAEDFRKAYGSALGEHIYEKWKSFKRDLTKMFGYLGNDISKGQKFIGMIMEKVRLYEKRITTEQS